MKWRIFIDEPKGIIEEELSENQEFIDTYLDDKISIVFSTILKDRGAVINSWLSNERDYDHTLLIYDGHFVYDGIANHSFYTMKLNGFTDYHSAQGRIDYKIKTEYIKGNGLKIFTEILHKFYSIFFVEEKADLIKKLYEKL